jgi:hypothetical protein
MDGVLIDYRNMREMLENYLSTENSVIWPILYAVNYAESCIANLHRANLLAEAIGGDKTVPRDKKIGILRSDVRNRIRIFRNEILHVDEKLTDGTWKAPEAQCVMLYDDCLDIYRKRILYQDLAKWVTQLHALSQALAQYKEV